ncbi:MAG: hypothetical protein IJ634_05415 [Bacteroidales bacterium]|nr:hypothetical protein [Bacteroidales bacterium]
MATGSMVGLAPLMMMVLLGLWWDTHCTAYFGSPENREASFMETSERVVMWVEAYQWEHGHLPDTLKTEWLYKDWDYDWYYYDTTKWHWQEFVYHHWDDSAYIIASANRRYRYISAPQFEGFLLRRWDEASDSERVDTVFRCF